MKETLELRVDYDYAHLLFKPDEGKDLGTSVKIIELSPNDSRYNQIPIIAEQIKIKCDRSFFFGWNIKRKYDNKELDTAKLLHLKINNVFEPSGEECGTIYDESEACGVCGANRKQINTLILKKGSIPKKDISLTIGGEIVVSRNFKNSVERYGLKGFLFTPVKFRKEIITDYYQLVSFSELELSHSVVVGINPFDLSISSGSEIYKCPKGHTLGLNLLSEPSVYNNKSIIDFDFFLSKQKIGVKRGLLRPKPLYFCSQNFRKMVLEERLKGFDFEVTNIETI
ncbi:hypothetical protein R1T16_10505 [Flavobacterium sp. DG1-102-2]|uniref:hypothetical protein n=1 Tax=Flavobacterium sp. DG1-102-2 TaxID=3081663 RepID=UPI002949CE1C|nr:hypothetical protein [Flavobacterium sp. DG1-102-2]MDV6168857.1 hypothetical protein [Flavobacterium sp. DG1-102-2]